MNSLLMTDLSIARLRASSIALSLLAVTIGLVVAYLSNSVLGLLIPLVLPLAWVVLRRPMPSLVALIVVNALIVLRPKDAISGLEAPSALDLVLGLLLAAIMTYWLLKIRVLDNQPLTHSAGQLLLLLFLVWSAIATAIGITAGGALSTIALREFLNIVPAFFFCIFYERFIEPDSREETLIFVIIGIAVIAFLIANILAMKSNLARAYYLYQIGRGSFDITFEPFVILACVSILMAVRSKAWIAVIPVLYLGIIALVISMSRNLYFATPLAASVVLFLGRSEERARAVRRLFLAFWGFLIGLVPVYLMSRLFRLLTSHYVLRLLSSQALKKDRAFGERLAEWQSEWEAIKHSPIIGDGFGARFRFFEPVRQYHVWQDFSHSSYLYILFKTGFVGGILFFTAFVLLSMKAVKLLRRTDLSFRQRIVLRASSAFLIIILFSAYMGPVFDSKIDTMWLGLVWGYFLALEKQLDSQESINPC